MNCSCVAYSEQGPGLASASSRYMSADNLDVCELMVSGAIIQSKDIQ